MVHQCSVGVVWYVTIMQLSNLTSFNRNENNPALHNNGQHSTDQIDDLGERG